MKIKFQGTHKADEVVDSLTAILRLFEEQYGVGEFSQIKLHVALINDKGEEVELIDSNTSEVFDVLEVHKNLDEVDEQYLNGEVLQEMPAGTIH